MEKNKKSDLLWYGFNYARNQIFICASVIPQAKNVKNVQFAHERLLSWLQDTEHKSTKAQVQGKTQGRL